MNILRFRKTTYPVLFIGLLLIMVVCKPGYYTIDDFARVDKIDAHGHYWVDDSTFMQQAQTDNFRLLSINVDYSKIPPIEIQQEVAVSLKKQYPGRFAYASTFGMSGWDSPDWQEKTIEYLDKTFAEGAVAVKVWKNIGMEFRDKDANVVMLDDPRFDIIFGHLSNLHVPLMCHTGEPKNCWLPLDEMTVAKDKKYFQEHPEFHMYLHPEMPSYEDILAARDRMLDKNKDLLFVGVHLASLEWSVDELAKFLDRFPRAMVDLAARTRHLQYQSNKDREKVREFVIKYQDRILYGADHIQDPSVENLAELQKHMHDEWLSDWTYYVSDETMMAPELGYPVQGLALPSNVIDKIFRLNAEKTFPDAWKE